MTPELWNLLTVIGGALIVRMLPSAGPILALLRPLLSRVPVPPVPSPVPAPNAPALPPAVPALPNRPVIALALRLLGLIPPERQAQAVAAIQEHLGVESPPAE